MRAAHTGKTLSEEHKRNIGVSILGENNGFYGKTHSDETKKKLSDINKLNGKFAGMNNPSAKVYDLSDNPLIGPNGEVVTHIECLSIFCNEHGLSIKKMPSVIRGKVLSHKGWRMCDPIIAAPVASNRAA